MNELHSETPNQYLKYRLEFVLKKWREILEKEQKKKSHSPSSSVFEAILRDDDYFFQTTSVPELLHRLLKSFDKNYKVKNSED